MANVRAKLITLKPYNFVPPFAPTNRHANSFERHVVVQLTGERTPVITIKVLPINER